MKQIDRKIYTATGGGNILSVDLIINSISGRLKKLKFQKKLVEEDEAVLKILTEYKFNLATNFNIHKDNEYQFLYFCVKDSLFKKEYSKNKFEFIQFLQKKTIEFNKLKKE